jgi:hypothetical protein
MKFFHKYAKLLLLGGGLCMAGSACNKDFLEVPPQGQITEQAALTDPGAANNMVTGVYNSLYFGDFGNTTVGFLYVIATDVASDDGDKGSTPTDFSEALQIDTFGIQTTNFILDNLWKGYYQGIARCNRAIDILERSTIDETTKLRLLGESRFLRGLYYFNLVRLFGGVPKIIEVPTVENKDDPRFNTRATKEEIYAVVKEDLQFAVDNLPLKGEGGTESGRGNKGAAQTLLAKVHMYLKEWQDAYDLTQAVINSGKYALVDDYAGMFREVGVNNSESVFEVQTGSHRGTDNCDAVSPKFSNSQGPRSKGGWSNTVDGKRYDGDLGFGFNSPSQDLVSAYEAGDKRKDATIIFVNPTVAGGPNTGTVLWDGFRIPTKDSVENDRYSYKAYHSPFKETPSCNGFADKDFKPKNIRILRYSETLLINAEAAAGLVMRRCRNETQYGKGKTRFA